MVLASDIPDGAVVFDVRHQLTDASWGPAQYAKGHIPGAFHAHIDRDLAGPVGDGRRGRHPMPLVGVLPRFLSMYGVTSHRPIVAYDDMGGAWAARLWWLARDHGHPDVRLLDGGITAWKAAGRPLATQHERPQQGDFKGQPGHMPTMDAVQVEAGLADGTLLALDARAPERYRGEKEPVDPVAGHIPGAVNAPFAAVTGSDGRMKSPTELRDLFAGWGVTDASKTVVYCGSGVTSALLVAAGEVAGIGTLALYPGSWSEWCRTRAAATGPEPGVPAVASA